MKRIADANYKTCKPGFRFSILFDLQILFRAQVKGAASTSAGIIGGFQAMNVLTIAMVIMAIVDPQAMMNEFLAVVLFIVFQAYTYSRYMYPEKHSIDAIEKKWLSKNERSGEQIRLLLLLYGFISVIAFFGMAIYLGNKK